MSENSKELPQMEHSATSKQSAALVYTYRPLETNFLDGPDSIYVKARLEQEIEHEQILKQQQQDIINNNHYSSAEEGNGGDAEYYAKKLEPLTTVGCARTGVWNLRYEAKETGQEFMRFCHRTLESAAVMAVYAIGGTLYALESAVHNRLLQAVVSVVFWICLFVEIYTHLTKRGGPNYLYSHAVRRQICHVLSAACIVWAGSWPLRLDDLSCLTDEGNYVAVHGHGPGPTTRYGSCIRSINNGITTVIVMGLCTLRLDIHIHFLACALQWIGRVYSIVVMAPEYEVDGLIWNSTPEEKLVRIAITTMATVVACLVGYAKHRSLQRAFESSMEAYYQMRSMERKLEAVDNLMTSMVPASALGRLMAGEKVFDASSVSTVLFTDMVQFTRWSSVRNPMQVVGMLSVLVKEFDILATEREITKVKTIGDCYWAVTGIPTHMANHAEVMIDFALALLDLVQLEAPLHEEWDYPPGDSGVPVQDFPVQPPAPSSAVVAVASPVAVVSSVKKQRRPMMWRTGIHSGPIQAGVLGIQQISYEIFGLTSTTANAVESAGVPSQVCVSSRTKRYVEHYAADPTQLPFTFSTHPTGNQVPFDEVAGDDDGEGEAGAIFVVAHNSDGDRSSLDRSSRSSRLSDQSTILRAKAARDQRRDFIEKQLAKKASSAKSDGLGEDLAGQLVTISREAVIEEWTVKENSCCVRGFALPGFEEEFRRFATLQLVNVRFAGSALFLTLLGMVFAVFLAEASGSINFLTAVLFLISIGCATTAAALAYKRKYQVNSALECCDNAEDDSVQEAATRRDADIVGPTLQFVSLFCWILGAFLAPSSIVTTDSGFIVALFMPLVIIPNNHLPTAPLMWAYLPCLLLHLFAALNKRHTVFGHVIFVVLIQFWGYMVTRMHETRLRVQFVEARVANHFVQKQALAMKAQSAVLGSMMPDFVIEPLKIWLASNFDPSKAVGKSYNEVCLAFISMSAEAMKSPKRTEENNSRLMLARAEVEEAAAEAGTEADDFDVIVADNSLQEKKDNKDDSHEHLDCAQEQERERHQDDDGSADWLFEGHKKVDQILSDITIVDKVKTVGDLIIIAGSFRGHSSTEAAAAMLSAVTRVHSSLDIGSGTSSATVGLHVGPVVGIVLGYSRLAFDIFGDAVNTCSRVMTTPSSKHRVTASVEFLRLLPEAPFKHHGHEEDEVVEYGEPCEVTAKGKGILTVREIRYSKIPVAQKWL